MKTFVVIGLGRCGTAIAAELSEEPPMSMKIQHNALLLSVRFP